MSHRNTPQRRSQINISPSIKGPNLLWPPCLELDSYSTVDTLPRQDASESDQRAAINRENELYTSLASNKPQYLKSTSIEADLLPSSTPRTLQKAKVIVSRGHRSKTVTRSHGSEKDLLPIAGLKPRPSGEIIDNASEVKQHPEIRITFEPKKIEGISFVGDFLAERKLQPVATPSILVNGQEGLFRKISQEESETKTIPSTEQLDTENITKSLFEKYHKEIPITEKDVILPTYGFTKSPRQEQAEEVKTTREIPKIPSRLQNDSRMPKIQLLSTIEGKIPTPKELPEVRTTKAIHRFPTNIIFQTPTNVSNIETKHRRYNTQIKERKPQLELNPQNLSKDCSQQEMPMPMPGSHVLAKTLERVQKLENNRATINKEIAFRQKVKGNYEFDFPRERTVQKAMAPDPKAYVNSLMKKFMSKRDDRSLYRMTSDKNEVLVEEILDLDAKEKSMPKLKPVQKILKASRLEL